MKVPSPDGDTDFFDIVAGVMEWDTLVSYLQSFLLTVYFFHDIGLVV